MPQTIDVEGPGGVSVSFPVGTDSATIHSVMMQATGQQAPASNTAAKGDLRGNYFAQFHPDLPPGFVLDKASPDSTALPEGFVLDKPNAPRANYFAQFHPEMSGAETSIGADVAKQIGAGLVTGAESIPGTVPFILGSIGKGVQGLGDKFLPGLFSKEREQQQSELKDLIATNRGGGIAQYLPQPQTTVGQYARTAAEFVPASLGAPGGVGRNVAAGLTAGLASEGAGQATQGTAVEPWARGIAALGGGVAGLRTAEGRLGGVATRGLPSNEAIQNAAVSSYKDLRSANVAQPIAQAELDNLASDITATVNREGPRRSLAGAAHGAIDEIKSPGTAGQADVADLISARQNLKGFFQNPMPDPNKAVAAIAIPKIDAVIERLSPGTMEQLRAADANYSAAKTSQALDKRMVRADLRAAGEHSGMNLGNRIRQNAASMLLSNKESRGLGPAEQAALEQVVKGTLPQNLMRMGSNMLGGGGGLGTTLLGAAGLGAGYETGHPELALAGFAGMGLRGLANRSVARQAANVDAMIRGRAPFSQAAGVAPAPRLTQQQAALLATLLARPAMNRQLP
jgi:hypothetical protein